MIYKIEKDNFIKPVIFDNSYKYLDGDVYRIYNDINKTIGFILKRYSIYESRYCYIDIKISEIFINDYRLTTTINEFLDRLSENVYMRTRDKVLLSYIKDLEFKYLKDNIYKDMYMRERVHNYDKK